MLVATNTFANLFIALWHHKSWCISQWLIFHVYKLAAYLVKAKKEPEIVNTFSYLQLQVQLQCNIWNVTVRLIHAVKVKALLTLSIKRVTSTLLHPGLFTFSRQESQEHFLLNQDHTQRLQKVNMPLCNFLFEYYVWIQRKCLKKKVAVESSSNLLFNLKIENKLKSVLITCAELRACRGTFEDFCSSLS